MIQMAELILDGLAEKLYSTYCSAVGGVAYNGTSLPSWKEFKSNPEKDRQVKGWIAVAAVVIDEEMRRAEIAKEAAQNGIQ